MQRTRKDGANCSLDTQKPLIAICIQDYGGNFGGRNEKSHNHSLNNRLPCPDVLLREAVPQFCDKERCCYPFAEPRPTTANPERPRPE